MRTVRIGSLAVVALATLGLLTAAQPPPASSVSGSPTAPPVAGPAPLVAESFRSARGYQAVAVPVRLRIPALRVDSRLQPLGLQADGSIAVPASPHVAGWYRDGPRPGQAGPAVILGHVDSRSGPGIFAGLAGLRGGAVVRVDRADGSSVAFRVTGISRVPKDAFPTDLVYAPTLDPALRLVTCGGGFDRARGSYRDNVIAFADRA
jgi:hypothetical protein